MAHDPIPDAEDDPREELLERPTASTVEATLCERLYALDTELSASPNGATLAIAHPGDGEPAPADGGQPLVEVTAHALGDDHDAGGVSRNVVADIRPISGIVAETELYLPAEVWSAMNRAFHRAGLENLKAELAAYLQ